MELLVLGLLALIAVQAEEVSTEQTDGIFWSLENYFRQLYMSVIMLHRKY